MPDKLTDAEIKEIDPRGYGPKSRESIAITFGMFIKLLLETPFIPDKSINTLETDGTEVRYNPDFLDNTSHKDIIFKFLHELAHKFLGHHLRMNPEKHDHEDANLAMDYAVNSLLLEAGLTRPKDAYYKHKFRGMAWEEIYKIIHQDDDEQFDPDTNGILNPSPELSGDGDEDSDCSDMCIDPDSGQVKSKRQQKIEEHDKDMQEMIQAAMMAGTIPADLERFVKDMFKAENNWRDILAQLLVKTVGMDDYTFSKPNKRYSSDEFIMPGLYSESSETVAVAVDTSGSIGKDELKRMTGDIVGLAEDVEPERLIIMSCDTRIQSYQEFEDGEPVDNLNLRGGGGTDFIPPFKELEKRGVEPQVLIYLTDGYCNRFPEPPEYEVIWVIWQDRHEFKPPFGEVIVMEGV